MVKGNGNVCGGVKRGGVKGEAPPPTLCQNIRHTLPAPIDGSHLSSGEPDGSQDPLLLWKLFYYLLGLRTNYAKQRFQTRAGGSSTEGQLTSLVHRAKAGPTWKRPPDPSLLRHSGERPSPEQPCSDQEQAARPVGQEADGVLPWCGRVRTSVCDEGAGLFRNQLPPARCPSELLGRASQRPARSQRATAPHCIQEQMAALGCLAWTERDILGVTGRHERDNEESAAWPQGSPIQTMPDQSP